MKTAILLLLKKAGVALSGPLGWLASLFIDKLISFLFEKGKELFIYLKDKITNALERRVDEKNSAKYEETLSKPGKSESDIDSATSDFLNGRD